MPEGSRARALEIIRLLEERRAKGDRVGIVTYGREARVERLPEEFGEAGGFVQQVDGNVSVHCNGAHRPDGGNRGDSAS
jgi:hypothetical protein